MSEPRFVAVLGLGLMGGSLARDLAARGVPVTGFDREAAVLDAAVASGVLQGPLEESLEGIERADLIVLALPVDRALAVLDRLKEQAGSAAILTDLGSTKRSIVSRAGALGLGRRFVGSHPLAGDHRSGWEASREGLFRDAPVFLCPAADADPDCLASVESLWRSVGARPEVIDAETHDLRMAWVSHLPQVAASALAATLASGGRAPAELGPGGRDATRLAGSSPEMWAAICRENADLLLPAISELRRHLADLESALASNAPPAVLDWFRRGREWVG
jgi:prephenate dehydrogenase